ncbi:MAG: IucA/IucC family protein [Bacillota bacterium]
MLRSDLKLEKEEMKIYDFLESKFPHLLGLYGNCVSKARFMIMERLVNALLREGFLENEYIEAQLAYSKQLEFIFSRGKLIIPIADRFSYNRFKLECNPIFTELNLPSEIVHPSFLLEVMRDVNEEQTKTYTNFRGFQAELANSVANLALSLLFQDVRIRELQTVMDNTGSNSIFELAEGLARNEELCDKSLFYEQLSVTGHLLHPCTKSKIGLSIEEIMHYSAEFDSTLYVHFVAIHKEVAYHNPKIKGEEIQQFWLREYPELIHELKQSCIKNKQDINDFFIIPIHPWQKENVLDTLYSAELARGQILVVDYAITTKPTLSVRTVLPVEKNFHIKLPLNIQMTSAVRTISPNSIHNGPEITFIVNDILSKEDYFNKTLHIIGEELGVRFQSTEKSEHNFTDRNKNLSYLIRKTPTSFLDEGEHAVVACALFNLSPVTKRFFLFEMVEQFHLRNRLNSMEENLFLFFKKYMTVVLSGVIPLMTKYGIGLEGHLQNTLIVLKEWEPVKVLIRDLGGVRIDQKRLERKGLYGTYFPGSVTISEDEIGMQNKVIHTVFQSHIGELTYHLAKEYQVNEQILWDMVKDICTGIFLDLEKDETIKMNVERDRAALFGETIQTKALTLMRLTDDVTDYAFIDLPNPLRD